MPTRLRLLVQLKGSYHLPKPTIEQSKHRWSQPSHTWLEMIALPDHSMSASCCATTSPQPHMSSGALYLGMPTWVATFSWGGVATIRVIQLALLLWWGCLTCQGGFKIWKSGGWRAHFRWRLSTPHTGWSRFCLPALGTASFDGSHAC